MAVEIMKIWHEDEKTVKGGIFMNATTATNDKPQQNRSAGLQGMWRLVFVNSASDTSG